MKSLLHKLKENYTKLKKTILNDQSTYKLDIKNQNVIFFSGLVIVIIAVYAQVTSLPRFSPEWPLFYSWNANLKLHDLIDWYNPYKEFCWYRPTSFVSFYQITTPFITWKNILGYQILTLVIILVHGITVYFFTKQLFKDSITAAITSILVVIHPIYFSLVYNLFMTDYLYQIFILLIGIIFCGNFLERKNAFFWFLLTYLLFILAITSKEQSIGLPIFLLAYIVLSYLMGRKEFSFKSKINKYRIGLFLLTFLTTAFFIFIYVNYQTSNSGNVGNYRTGLNWEILLSNITSGPLWLSHIFFFDSFSWGNFRLLFNNFANNFYGIVILFATISYLVIQVKLKKQTELKQAIIALAFTASFIILPIYSGGRPWHYALPVVTFMMLYGRFISICLEKFSKKSTQLLFLTIVICIPTLLSTINFRKETRHFDKRHKPDREAFIHAPVQSKRIPLGATISYYPLEEQWVFGCGVLFSYTYNRTDIKEISTPKISQVVSDSALKYLETKDFFCFDYNKNRRPCWKDISSIYKFHLIEKVPVEKRTQKIEDIKTRLSKDIKPNYHINEAIIFKEACTGSNYCYSSCGWMESEKSGTCTNNNNAFLLLKLFEAPSYDLNLFIGGNALMSEKRNLQKIDIFINDSLLGKINYTGTNKTELNSIRIPKNLILSENLISIRFVIKELKNKDTLGITNETKKDGFCLTSIQIKPYK